MHRSCATRRPHMSHMCPHMSHMCPHMSHMCPHMSHISGEILVSGNNVAQGYYKNEEETEKAFIRHKDGKIWY